MNSSETLPISVIIPTRNSMDKLPRHLDRHAGVFLGCVEIIHCDSQSHDGTQAYLAQTLAHPRLKQFDHAPGLYPSWNYAIEQCTQKFIYISTVGDEIDHDGLNRLVNLAVKTDADIVMSPPRFIDEAGRTHENIQWPINNLIKNHGVREPRLISSALVYSEAIFHAPDGILGSAASCLYKTSFLKPRPFPLGFHGACDSAWALRHVPEARCAIIPESLSVFLLHPKSYESHGVLNARIAVLVRDFLRRELHRLLATSQTSATNDSPLPGSVLKQLRNFNLIALLRARYEEKLLTLRKKMHGLWFLSPHVWMIRRYRNHYRRLAAQLAVDARQELEASLNLSATD